MDSQDNAHAKFEPLFRKELLKANKGESADELANLIKDYEFSINRTAPLSKQHISVYYAALLLSHKFIELQEAVARNGEIPEQPQQALYKAVAKEGRRKNFKNLIAKTNQLCQVTQNELKKYFPKAIKSYILKSLSKDYLNIEISYLQQNFGITKQDLQENDCQTDGLFTTLPKTQTYEKLDELMDDRIRQLTKVTEYIVK